MTAIQRGVERWQPADASIPMPVVTSDEITHLSFGDIDGRQFVNYLPFAGGVAAGFSSHDLEAAFYTSEIDSAGDPVTDGMESSGLQWVECPSRLTGKRRFVVEVTGDSMEPTFSIGDYVVCEYHRHCQPNHRVVIMANFSDLPDRGECAIKRISESTDEWVFVSDNPVYEDIHVSKVDSSDEYPIYGTVIYNLTKGRDVR